MRNETMNHESLSDTEEIILDEDEFEAILLENEKLHAGEAEEIVYEEYADDEVLEDETSEEYYEDDTSEEYEEDSEEYDESDDYDEDEYDEEPERERKGRYSKAIDSDYEDEDESLVTNIFSGKFADKLIYLLGAVIIIFALFVGVALITSKPRMEAVGPDMSQIGTEVDNINLIGEAGLKAVFESEAGRISELYEAQETFEYQEVDEETGLINVDLALTSILKDLKIKFVNKNNKLVANVPFEVEVTDASGNTKSYKDEDKDGVIHIEGLSGGDYRVKMKSLKNFESLYSFSTETASINVKNQIEYKKVDVSNEIKTEAQVDVKKEDTKVAETVVEAQLKDTVEYVVSAKTLMTDASGYQELKDLTTIQNPLEYYKEKDAARFTTFRKLDTSGNDPGTITQFSVPSEIVSGQSGTGGITLSNGQVSSITWTSSDTNVLSISNANQANPTLTAGAVTTDTNVSVSVAVQFLDGSSDSKSGVVVVRGADKSSFKIANFSQPTIYPGATFDLSKALTVSVTDKLGNPLTSGYTLSYSSDKAEIATVSDSGVITGVAEGTATITVSCSASNMTTKSSSFPISINKSGIAIALNYNKKTIFLGEKETDHVTLVPTITGASNPNLGVTWKSSNEAVVKVSENGILTPVGEGSATITASSKESPKVIKECAITVVNHPSLNKVTLLKDKDGNQVYVYDEANKKYVEAKYADYYSGVKLYVPCAVEYKYTGWWNVNGKSYYYNKSGEKVTGEQVILGTKYNFASDGSLISGNGTFGIDVSKWNGTIDWASVAKSGVSFAIIRSGFRGSTEGGLIEDTKFVTNIKNATANGIKVGVYFFTQAKNEVEAVEEASMVLGQVSGYKISYPIFLDVESAGAGARAEDLSKAERTAVINAFCKTISNAGYTAGLYANKTWLNNKINTSELTAYKIWIAQYNTEVTYTATRYDLWQYTSKGSLNGISGDVDFDTSYLGY